MGKTLTAAQMLNAGRKRPPTPAGHDERALKLDGRKQADAAL